MWRRLLSSPVLFKHSLLPESAVVMAARRRCLLPSPSLPWCFVNGGIGGVLQNRSELTSLLKNTVLFSKVTQSSSSLSNSNESKSTSKTTYESNNNTQSSDSKCITCEEAKRVIRLVNLQDLKLKLTMENKDKDCISYNELIDSCQLMGIARSFDEAVDFARVLDDAGVVFRFRDKIYLHPHKVVDLVRQALPLDLTPENDELKRLHESKEEIDVLAHKQVRRILCCGLGLSVTLLVIFFRLTFWEFSWDVMEPVAFFVTSIGIIVGYSYFLYTARDPTYQDLRKRLFLSRQRKLFKKLNFDVERYKESQRKCRTTLDTNDIKNVLLKD